MGLCRYIVRGHVLLDFSHFCVSFSWGRRKHKGKVGVAPLGSDFWCFCSSFSWSRRKEHSGGGAAPRIGPNFKLLRWHGLCAANNENSQYFSGADSCKIEQTNLFCSVSSCGWANRNIVCELSVHAGAHGLLGDFPPDYMHKDPFKKMQRTSSGPIARMETMKNCLNKEAAFSVCQNKRDLTANQPSKPGRAGSTVRRPITKTTPCYQGYTSECWPFLTHIFWLRILGQRYIVYSC